MFAAVTVPAHREIKKNISYLRILFYGLETGSGVRRVPDPIAFMAA
jgi:hypothetical protein